MTAYGILAGLLWRALAPAPADRRHAILVWGIAILYAASDEAHQLFVPGRHGSLIDVAIDGVGAWIAVVALRRYAAPAGRRAKESGQWPRKLTAQALCGTFNP